MDGKEPSVPAALLPKIVCVTTLACSTETSGDAATMDSDPSIVDGTIRGPLKKPDRSVRRCYECSVCGRRFRNRKTAKNHLVLHTDEMKYTCTVCNLKFAQRPALFKHQRVHTGEMPVCVPSVPVQILP
ncbi:hypothetical protein HPB49_017928 [Dermacentor silvarum]|uniref:Uncharacterized protein n=1 Tax=Dermacentor silvarum TaxID=543639 RepID=A0ACB8DJH7_DERSI|nr:hypothetical protein HPB49_017928 [Dermacentor silvarum]